MTSEKHSDSEPRPVAANSQEPKILLATDESKLLGANVYGASPATADESAALRSFQFRSFHCPICFANIAIRREQAGQKLVCPDCLSEIVAPTDLNFDSQTEYEERYFNEEKRKRDELLSPARNPNRIGLDLSASNVYGVSQSTEEPAQSDESFYVAIRCAVCGTIMQVPRAELGAKVRCPDCFTEVIARDDKTNGVESSTERKRREEEKKKRDELYSPARNPNREGIDFGAHDVYGVSDVQQASAPQSASSASPAPSAPPKEAKRPKSVLYPVRCRVCETIMHVPRERLGQEVTCPDCGSVTIASAALKEQRETIDAKFQPRDRGTYGIGEVPLPPSATYRTDRGETVKLDGSKPMIAPTEPREPKAITLEEFKKKHGITSAAGAPNQAPTPSVAASSQPKSVAPPPKKKSKRPPKTSPSPEDNLPPRVLRKRNGEFVWTTASPPNPIPLFNGSFSPLGGVDLWARAVMLGVVFAVGILIGIITLIAAQSDGSLFKAMAPLLVALGLVPVWAYAVAVFTQFFSAIYRSSAMGARRVLDWSNDEQLVGLVLSGVRFALFALASLSCGFGIVAFALRTFAKPVEPDNLLFALGALEINGVLSWLFFATFWISSDARGALFCPITISVLTTFWRRKGTWLLFALYAVFILTPLSLVSVLALMNEFLIVKFLAALTIPLLALLAAPVLGRLAWIVEDNARNSTFDD